MRKRQRPEYSTNEIIGRFVNSSRTEIDPLRRLSDADAMRIFSLRGPNLLIPSPPEVRIQKRIFLNLAEAAVYSGIPQSELKELIASRKLPANEKGPIRVRRDDLEKLWAKKKARWPRQPKRV